MCVRQHLLGRLCVLPQVWLEASCAITGGAQCHCRGFPGLAQQPRTIKERYAITIKEASNASLEYRRLINNRREALSAQKVVMNYLLTTSSSDHSLHFTIFQCSGLSSPGNQSHSSCFKSLQLCRRLHTCFLL